jgi:hypothetical protein
LVATACGGGDGGGGGGSSSSAGDSGGETSTAASSLDTATTMPVESSGDSAAQTSSDEGSSGVAESSSEAGTTGSSGACDPPMTRSICGNENSIVRGTATVGDGAPTSGALMIALTHQYLGDGAAGGIYHAAISVPDVDFTAGPVPFELDMCLGGEMWSEENCEFQIAVTLDVNGNGVVDAGEPTGKQFVFVSCMGDNPCLELALDCVDGSSCVAFPDPPYCGCAGNGGMCNSPIVAC